MISAKKDTIVDYAFNNSDKITNAGIEIEIEGFQNGNISSNVLCKLDRLSLQTCLYLTDMNDSLSTIKLNNVLIESFLVSSPGFISRESRSHYDREWEINDDYVDREIIESLCKYHLKWICFSDIKLKTKEGTQFR